MKKKPYIVFINHDIIILLLFSWSSLWSSKGRILYRDESQYLSPSLNQH